jgi:hypothetical protein
LDLSPLYRTLASMTNLTFVIYNGQSDGNVPYNGQVTLWITDPHEIETDWAPWFIGETKGPTVGHVRTYRMPDTGHTFPFVLISGAGHEVPAYRPEAALSMLNKFVL